MFKLIFLSIIILHLTKYGVEFKNFQPNLNRLVNIFAMFGNNSSEIQDRKRTKRETNVHNFEGYKINGENAKENQFSYLVSLRSTTTGQHFCSGVIVSSMHVLTAAHCICLRKNQRPAQDILVAVGRFSLGSNITDKYSSHSPETYKYLLETMKATFTKTSFIEIINPSSAIYPVYETTCHPQFDDTNMMHDIAVLTSYSQINFDTYVSKISMVAGKTYDVPVTGDLPVIVTGWGGIKNDVQYLYYVDTTTLNENDCKEILKRGNMDNLVDVWNFCTPGGSNDCSGEGDSGGPVVHNGALLGIVSWATCFEHAIVVHTSVPYNYDWINHVI